ncbi:hypothetical protein CEXT_326781 [Caerostris extrusa]|uniref:Uncharacterized protein n=1 Tax=Caerostris extrusa TaxID=172846 RepID=A0AAV4R249_CAEEX|nr:hypothetical protein CEXT_326781 [Caerostris extrusa]
MPFDSQWTTLFRIASPPTSTELGWQPSPTHSLFFVAESVRFIDILFRPALSLDWPFLKIQVFSWFLLMISEDTNSTHIVKLAPSGIRILNKEGGIKEVVCEMEFHFYRTA